MQWVPPIKDKETIEKLNLEVMKEEPQVMLCYILESEAGLSQHTALALRIRDVIDKEEVVIQAGKKEVTFPLPEPVREKIREYIEANLADADMKDFLIPLSFASPSIPYKSAAMTRRIGMAAKRSGILSFGAQSPRKTFLYRLYEETGDIGLVQKYINAPSSSIAYRYLGILPGVNENYKARSAEENENSRYKLISEGAGAKRIAQIKDFLFFLADEIDDPRNSDAVYGKIDGMIGMIENCIEKYKETV